MSSDIQYVKGKLVNFAGIRLAISDDLYVFTKTAMDIFTASGIVMDFGVAATHAAKRDKYQRFGIIPEAYMEELKAKGLGSVGQQLVAETNFSPRTPQVIKCYRIG